MPKGINHIFNISINMHSNMHSKEISILTDRYSNTSYMLVALLQSVFRINLK